MNDNSRKQGASKKSRRAAVTSESSKASEETVKQILLASRGVLIEHGYAGFTTRRVAEAAAISPGNLSYHFPTKRELLQALITQLTTDYAAQFQAILANSAIPSGQEVQQLVQWLLADAVTDEGVRTFRELWAMSLHDEVICKAIDDLYDTLMKLVAELLQRSHPYADAKAVGEVVQVLALFSEGSIVLYGTRRHRNISFERIIELVTSILEGMTPDLHDPA